MNATHSPTQKIVLDHPRISGIALLAACGLGVYITIFLPIKEAQEHADRVEISGKGAVASIVLGILGLAFLCFGTRIAHILMPGANQSKVPAYIAGAVIGVLGITLNLWVKSYIQSQGYVCEW